MNAPLAAPRIRTAPAELRILGTSVTLLDEISARAAADLGIRISHTVLDGVAAQRTGVLAAETFDLYDQWFHNIDFVWIARSIQPIELERIVGWDDVNDLPKTGTFGEGQQPAQGSAPHRRLFVQPDGTLGATPSERITMLPLSHCADSFGYRPDLMPADLDPSEESWSWLVDRAWRGRVALQNDAAIGALDAALAVSAAGLAAFDDFGNLSLAEIDALVDALLARRKAGHFSGFWATPAESVELLSLGRTRLASIWSPAAVELRKQGVPIRVAAPKEGYRGWFGGMAISRRTSGRALDMAYEYLNWWMAGWPGAVLARQGYYFSAPARVREHLSPGEWDYWYAGRPASEDLPGPDGAIVVRQGERRDGGSYRQRMSRIAAWNAVMDEHNYLVRRWNDVLRYRP